MKTIQRMKNRGNSRALLLAGALGFSAVLTQTTHAQYYAIDWDSIDNGGGTTAVGTYAMSGTIGQPDAGSMSGSPYALSGGFWSFSDVPPAPVGPLPFLSIERSPGGAVRVFWTRPATGYLLEELSSINGSSPTGWTTVAPSSYQTNATHISISIPNPTGMRIYRLSR